MEVSVADVPAVEAPPPPPPQAVSMKQTERKEIKRTQLTGKIKSKTERICASRSHRFFILEMHAHIPFPA
jgi:hypothetical protein